jgi:hypothetical protein
MWLKVYDPARTPAHWLEIIRPGEYSVFIFDAHLRVPKDYDGHKFRDGETSVQIASDFDEALRFAQAVVASHPELCCEIYGNEGKSGEPLRTVYEPSVQGKYEGFPWARREASIGLSLVAVAALFIVYDARHDLRWMWGYIIGAKLLIVGGGYLVRGAAGLYEHRFGPQFLHPKRQ